MQACMQAAPGCSCRPHTLAREARQPGLWAGRGRTAGVGALRRLAARGGGPGRGAGQGGRPAAAVHGLLEGLQAGVALRRQTERVLTARTEDRSVGLVLG